MERVKKRYRKNFSTLVFLHVFLLAFPLISKTVHVHHGLLTHVDYSGQASFHSANEFCPIYNFEFYSFVESTVLTTDELRASAPVYQQPAHRIHFLQLPDYFSLRAPPVA